MKHKPSMNQSDGCAFPQSLRPADRVRESLRDDIVKGVLSPGARLPTHAELAELFGVSNVTIQRALGQLSAEGFVSGRPRKGTSVVDSPPHLRNYALVFPFDPVAPNEGESHQWSKYYQALTLAATSMQGESDRRILQFHGINYHTDSEDRERLLRHIERCQLGGIIFASSPHTLAGTPILDAPGLPRVELSSSVASRWPAIHFNQGWMTAALAHLGEIGCRRPAILYNCLTRDSGIIPGQLDELIANHGMTSPIWWRQASDWRDPVATNHCVQLLMQGVVGERPDSLLVMDDNLIEGVTSGLIAGGLRVPQDIKVVAHANFPLPVAPAMPFELLGSDLRIVLRECIGLLELQRNGEHPPRVTRIPAIWQADISNTSPEQASVPVSPIHSTLANV